MGEGAVVRRLLVTIADVQPSNPVHLPRLLRFYWCTVFAHSQPIPPLAAHSPVEGGRAPSPGELAAEICQFPPAAKRQTSQYVNVGFFFAVLDYAVWARSDSVEIFFRGFRFRRKEQLQSQGISCSSIWSTRRLLARNEGAKIHTEKISPVNHINVATQMSDRRCDSCSVLKRRSVLKVNSSRWSAALHVRS